MACKSYVTLAGMIVAGLMCCNVEAACDGPEHRAFDFWKGQWDVNTADGTLAGTNSITAEQGDCVLVERWRGERGGAGTSLNFFDTGTKAWRQIWVSANTQIDISGGLQGGSMVLVGYINYPASGDRFAFRGTWTPLADGRVRQFFEEAREPGVWTTWFEGFYRRVDG